jgi:putative transposase
MIKERKTNRMLGYDYSTDNLYFITSCVHNRVCCFGEIKNHQMKLSTTGTIAENQWFWLCEQYPYVVLHVFVVMPNHVHGIIEIDSSRIVGACHHLPLQSVPKSIPVKIKSLSELMGAYKTTVSKQIHLLGYSDFAWQRSFHDHIIRDEISYRNISNYIINNPSKWEEDKFFNNDK